MIPDDALKVAKAAILYVTVGELTTEEADILARAAIEAAAPYLQSAAWERGVEDGYHHRPSPYTQANEN